MLRQTSGWRKIYSIFGQGVSITGSRVVRPGVIIKKIRLGFLGFIWAFAFTIWTINLIIYLL
jgi:hypothetical protein